MKELLKACLEMGDAKITSVEPCIKNDEQHYEVEFTNRCCSSGYDTRLVSLSEILVFMRRGIKSSLY